MITERGMMKKQTLSFVFGIMFFYSLHSQPRIETYAWMVAPADTCTTCGKIVRIFENDSTFMEIGMFYESDTAWYEIRNGKWLMKNHEKDSFALFFDTAFVNDTTAASWSYPIAYSKDNWSYSQGHCNEIRHYYWKKENKCYNGYHIYRVYYCDVRFDPPKEMILKNEDGTIKKHVWDTTRYIHPPMYYFFTYQLGIFGCYGGDLPLIRPGIDIVLP